MTRVLRNQKVKAISTLASGQDLLALLKPTPPTPLFMPKCFLFQTVFFFLASRLCFGGFYVLTEQMSRTHLFYFFFVVFEFLVFMICPLMQERFL